MKTLVTNSVDTNDTEVDTAKKSSVAMANENDITEVLRLTDHYTKDYPNGMTVGVKFVAIQGTRGVHVDVVFVLDLRKASFGKGGLAMRAAVLETMNRSLDKILEDVGLGESIHEHEVLTPWGRVHLPLLKGKRSCSLSLMHETRTIYVITESVKSAFDLSWLTDTGRIVAADEFALIRQSDARSKLPELKKSVDGGKWQILETGVLRGWFAVLSMVSLAIGLLTSITILISNSGSILFPAIVSTVSAVMVSWLLSSSRDFISSFNRKLVAEQEQLQQFGDTIRIMKSIEENENRLKLIADLNFVVSPLMATLGNVISKSDLQAMVNVSCSILDECARLAPDTYESSSVIHLDAGLRKFIGLFEYLGGNIEETNLALAYVGLTGHVTKPIAFGEVVSYITELNNSLYDIGALRPSIKEALDDRLNMIALEETADEFKKDIDSDREPLLTTEMTPSKANESAHHVSEEPASFDSLDSMIEDPELHDQILHASVDRPEPNEHESADELDIEKEYSSEDIVVIASDVVAANARKEKRRIRESDQLQLFDDYGSVQTSANIKEERGSAGV